MPEVTRDLDGNLIVAQPGGGMPLTFKKGQVSPDAWAKLESQVPAPTDSLAVKPPPAAPMAPVNNAPLVLDDSAAPINIQQAPIMGAQPPKPTAPAPGMAPPSPLMPAPMSAPAPAGPPLGVTTDRTTTYTSGVKADKKAIAAQDAAVAAKKEAIAQLGEVAKARAAGELDAQTRVNQQLDELETRAQIQREAIQRDTEEAERNYSKAVDEFGKMKVDNHRWWNNKDAGAKVGMMLGAFLGTFGSGVTHTPNESMNLINKEIDNDLAVQRDEIMNAKDGVNLKNNLVAQMKSKGLSFEQATIAAKQVKLEQAKRQMDALAMEHKTPEIDAKNAELQAEADKAIADTKVQQSLQAQGRAQTTTQTHIAPLTGHAAGAGQQLPAGEATKLGEAKGAVDNLNRLEKQFKEKGAGGAAGFVKNLIPFTDASKYGSDVRAAAQVIGGYLEGGKLTDTDYAKYMDLLPKPGDSEKTAANKMGNLRNLIGFRQRSQKDALQAAGYNVSGIKDANTEINFTPTGQ